MPEPKQAPTTVRRGRRPARSPEALRQDMLDSAYELLEERGISLGFDTVRLEDAIVAANAPRASAYRAWTDEDDDRSPQVRFHDELARHVLSVYPTMTGNRSDGIVSVIDALGVLDHLDQLSPKERERARLQVLRAGGNHTQAELERDQLWLLAAAVAGALVTQSQAQEDLLDAWMTGEQMLTKEYIGVYQGLAAAFGWRLRCGYTWEHFEAAVAATAQGIALRRHLNAELSPIRRTTGPDGSEEEWSLHAECLEALVGHFLEPDPDAEIQSLADLDGSRPS